MNEGLQWKAGATKKTGANGWYDQQPLQELLEWRHIISADSSVTLFQHCGRTTLLLFKAICHVIPAAEVESR